MRLQWNFSAPIMAFFVTIGLGTFTSSRSFAAVTFGSGYGVSANASTYANCPSHCTGDSDSEFNGGEFSGFASAISQLYGDSRAQAFYSQTNTYLPELKAFSSSTAGRGGSAGAFGVQGFAYLGTGSVSVNGPNGSDESSITFSVSPGGVFFVGASLSASSRTGTADAFSTFTSNFSDPNIASQLVVANPVSIPEPTSLACLSIVTIGWAARRRRTVRSSVRL